MTHLLTVDPRTKFQQAVFDALLLYSRNTLTADVAEKLLYILVPLESLFLKNRTEAIEQNLSERLACFLTSDAGERRRMINEVKAAYGARSRFVHHGESISDIETVEALMSRAWLAMGVCLAKMDTYSTVEEFVNAIDEIKLT